ncbi:MAG: NADPH-dependent FMN reductase [Bradyrhizobium sp.]
MAHTIVTIVGSLRKESFSLKIANALAKLAPASLKLDVTTLEGISFFNQDLEAAPPADWLAFRDKLQKSNGVLFVTPEYNRSIPAVVKNAIDWGTRPWGQNSWAGKPGSVIGTSPGNVGTAVAQAHLKSVLTILDVILLGQPEIYFVWKPGLINDEFEVTDDQTREFLQGYLAKFAGGIAQAQPKQQKAA